MMLWPNRPPPDNVRVVAYEPNAAADNRAAYAWPIRPQCNGCKYRVELLILADSIAADTRARGVRAVDDYLEAAGWRPRHGGNDLCPTCRANDEQVTKQLDALTAPGARIPGGQPSDAAVGDALDKLTTQTSAFAALDDEAQPSGDPVRDELSKLTSPWQCRVCDGENPPKTQACKRCGAPKPAVEADDEQDIDEDKWTCPVCGAAVDQDTDTCPLCGNERDTETDKYGPS